MSAKGKKSMMKMSRISPQLKALELQYGDDKEGYQRAMMKLYQDEGVSMTGGCLWSFIPLLIIIPLYQVIRLPFQYMMHLTAAQGTQITELIKQEAPDLFGRVSAYYSQLIAASHVTEYADKIQTAIPEIGKALTSINFNFLGIDLGRVPDYRFWAFTEWNWATVGLFLIPIFAAASQVISMVVSQKLNSQVATDSKGEKDKDAAATAAQSSKMMMYIMPLTSLWFCFIMPAAIAIYWIAQALFGMVQDLFLTIHYRKVYDAEDKIKQERAAQEALIEAEKERIRALRREQNPDGITENTSKKKLQQIERQKAEAAAKEYALKKAAEAGEVIEEKPVSESSVGNRPYARGRAYQRDRYKNGASETQGNANED